LPSLPKHGSTTDGVFMIHVLLKKIKVQIHNLEHKTSLIEETFTCKMGTFSFL
jgi:hypothetical protein